MTLCLANSLIVQKNFVAYDQLLRYKWWYRYGYMSSTGECLDLERATRDTIHEFEKRQQAFCEQGKLVKEQSDQQQDPQRVRGFDVNCNCEDVAGNSALLRLAPIPLFFRKHPRLAVQYAADNARLTHGDTKTIDTCRYYAALIVATLQGEKKQDLLDNQFYSKHESWFNGQALHPDIQLIAEGSYKKQHGYDENVRSDGYMVNPLEAILWAFWSTDDFMVGIAVIIEIADITGPIAGIYGQLAGAYYRFNGLPKSWRQRIYAHDFIVNTSEWIAYEGEQWKSNETASSE
jgi:ADP-ribosyl-[dinitrogen reductase] hydrolase